MLSTCMAVVIATVIMVVENNECKDYTLSATDQSLIDMMKIYLHTSRKDECPSPSKTSKSGVTYVRWGKKGCPKSADIVYTENGQHQSYDNNQVYGSEYQISSSMKSSGWSESMADKEVPCAVCYQKHRSTVLMIPGRKTCYKGWIPEYNGYLMSDHNTHFRRDFACVDINAEPMDNKNGNEDGAVFYPLRTKCGSLRCPPYTNEQSGWKHYSGHCYYFNGDNMMSWTSAKTVCNNKGGHLVKIDDSSESLWIIEVMKGSGLKSTWIGANDISREGSWVWESDRSKLTFSNWNKNQPDNGYGAEDCAHIYMYSSNSYRWNDYPCSSRAGYICERV